jgi:uncharacterized membrane protein YhiD involved in acid resistance
MNSIFYNVFFEGLNLSAYLLSAGAAILCGVLVAFASTYRSNITKSFFTALVLLPFAVQTVIIMVNGSVGTGIAVAGAFSLVRFRSLPAKARDIISIFVSMTAGLACAAGYLAIGILFTLIACGFFIALSSVNMRSDKAQELRITIPENINFVGTFDDLFEQYTSKCELLSVKSANMGSLYKLTYRIEMKNDNDLRDFIDDLRVRNGNLEIAIFKIQGNAEEL